MPKLTEAHDTQHRLLQTTFARCRGLLVTVLIFSFFINLLVFVGPLYMLQIYDRVLSSRSEVTLTVITLLAVGLLIAYGLLEGVRSRILVRAGVIMDDMMARRMFQVAFRGHVLRPGQPYTQSLRDVDSLREFVSGAGIIAFCDAPWVPIFIAACFLLHPWLGLVALAGAVVIFALALTNELATRGLLAEASSASVEAHNYVSSSIRNAETVHAMGMIAPMLDRWTQAHARVLSLQARASDRAGAIMGGFKTVRMSLQIAILGIGAYLVIQGELKPGAMVAASILMGRALAPVEASVGQWKQFVNARTAWTRIQTILTSVPADADSMSLPPPLGRIDFENVVVVPPGGRVPTLKGVSLSIEPGEVVAVIGPSGAGKSAFARAVVGVWPVAQGTVRIDGSDIRHWNPNELGRHVGYLPQEVELFAGTIAENIARFGPVEADAVIRAAQMAGAHGMIQHLPSGYNTMIGDAGRTLSGGQRQRIALARALHGVPRIIVLDEPNASLDSEGEIALTEAIDAVRSIGSTVIVVSHRTALLSHADKVAVIMEGTLRRFGPPNQVLNAAAQPIVTPLRASGAA
jgi:ATP-binding cassette subfamily C protein/ATP-binding cassette subfamily C protein EexD